MLPRVSVQAAPGEAPVVTVDGSPVAGVRSAQVTVGADHVPQVTLVLHAAEVDVELPAGVTVLRAGTSPAEFAERINPAHLEGLALGYLEHDPDCTQGEAWARAVQQAAAEHDHA